MSECATLHMSVRYRNRLGYRRPELFLAFLLHRIHFVLMSNPKIFTKTAAALYELIIYLLTKIVFSTQD
jgi:hypothetical protein